MKAWQATCIVGAITFTGIIYQFGGNAPWATVPDARPETAVSAETPAAPALSAAVPEASAGPGTPHRAELGSVPGAVSRPSLMAKAEIGDGSIETKSVDLRHHDAQPVPTTRDTFDDASNPAPVTQDFRYLIYYVWSELPPAEKPADVVLSSLKDIPVGTPVEEIKRASDAFGLDFNFMKAVAKVESGFDPKQRTGSYIGLFQLSKDEFNKFGSGHIRSPRDNAVAAAYKIITEGILFEWVTHKKPTLSDLYLIHQQGWEGAAEHISQPDRIPWKSMCATRVCRHLEDLQISKSVIHGEPSCGRVQWNAMHCETTNSRGLSIYYRAAPARSAATANSAIVSLLMR